MASRFSSSPDFSSAETTVEQLFAESFDSVDAIDLASYIEEKLGCNTEDEWLDELKQSQTMAECAAHLAARINGTPLPNATP